MLYFKFHQNRTINEEFDIAEVKGTGGSEECPDFKNSKSLIRNGGLNPHRKFQHSNSIRKCLKIGD